MGSRVQELGDAERRYGGAGRGNSGPIRHRNTDTFQGRAVPEDAGEQLGVTYR